jgi:hypothetical protein
VSAGGLVVFFLTTTLAAVDWIMSREPHWFSTILGLLFAVGTGCSAMAFLIIVLKEYFDEAPFKGIVRASILNDLGNLLMTTVILWAYMSLAQFLITWMGNLQEEVPWYLRRGAGWWSIVVFLLIVLHFFVPFIMLLSRFNKRRIQILGSIAIGVLAMRVIDTIWVIRPSDEVLRGFVPGLYIWDLFTPLAIGGLWLNGFLWTLSRRPLLPQNEPETVEILSHVQHAHG